MPLSIDLTICVVFSISTKHRGSRGYFMKNSLFVFMTAFIAASATPMGHALEGSHRSTCTPITLNKKPVFSRLEIAFRGKNYSSAETVYSDPKCEISVLETRSQGHWSIKAGKVLRLKLARLQMRSLDPRMSDALSANRVCGKKWENGILNEILNTPCGKGRLAEYFVGSSRPTKTLSLYECEGKRVVDASCTRYTMASNSKRIDRGLFRSGNRRDGVPQIEL